MRYMILALGIFFLSGCVQSDEDAASNSKIIRDLAFAKTPQQTLLLDLYLPTSNKPPYPLVIWIHGGGWIEGDRKNTGPSLVLLQHGYAVASVDYRLSSVAKFPAQIQDVKAAVRFLRAHSKKYNLDSKRFGAWGHSAGGHLAALLGTSGNVKEFEVGEYKRFSSRVQAVCDWAGPTDFTEVDIFKNETARKYEEYAMVAINLIGGPFDLNMQKVRQANPATHASKDDPPLAIFHGDKDGIVPHTQAIKLHQRLKDAGVKAELHIIKNAGHGFDTEREGEITPVLKNVLSFFDKHLIGKK